MVEYSYDAWGKPLTKTSTLATTLGTLNPFRYRGYVYDDETGLYYLRSRYYNPVWGRFLNADSVIGKAGGLLQHNSFAYCLNNPVLLTDTNGHMALEAAPSLSPITLEAFEYFGISLPSFPYDIIKESTDSNNVTTVVLQNRELKYHWFLTPNTRGECIGYDEITYTLRYKWIYHKDLTEWYEYNSVNSSWFEISLALGELLPFIGAVITLTEDFIVKPIVSDLSLTPNQKIFIKLLYVDNKVLVKTTK